MTDILKEKILPANITSYDLIKFVAVIIMVIDHIGFYFYPDILWFRAVGRIGFPIWFFLVGYSSGRDISIKLLGGAGLLLAATYIVGLPIFPLNALFTIIAIRLSIDFMMRPFMEGKMSLWTVSILLFLLVFPTYFLVEYGTQGLITAILGYLIRHRDRLENQKIVFEYLLFGLISFVFVQQFYFDFPIEQLVVVILGTVLTHIFLYNFRPLPFYGLTENLPMPFTVILQFMGRRTLEIYVVHLLIFKFAAFYLGDDRFEWFRLQFF